MIVKVRFVGSLRAASKRSRLDLQFEKTPRVLDLIKRLTAEKPQLKRALIDPELDDPRANALILVNGRDTSVLDGVQTKLADGDEVVLVPIVHGG